MMAMTQYRRNYFQSKRISRQTNDDVLEKSNMSVYLFNLDNTRNIEPFLTTDETRYNKLAICVDFKTVGNTTGFGDEKTKKIS